MRRILRENGLSIILMSLFLLFWVGQSVVGHREHNSEQRQHGQPEVAYGSYLRSAHFWEATAENWESEFFQMFGYVIRELALAGLPPLFSDQHFAARRVGSCRAQ